MYFSCMTHTITFLPSQKSCTAVRGTRISDVASQVRETGLYLECGGKGTCHKCLVELVEGDVEIKERKFTVAAGAKPLKVLSCQCVVSGDAVFSILSGASDGSVSMALGKDIAAITPDLMPSPDDISPVVKTYRLRADQPSLERHSSDFQRLEVQVRKAAADRPVRCGLAVLRILADAMRERSGLVTVRVLDDGACLTVVSVEPGDAPNRDIGIACDIGTTTVSVHCLNLHGGKVLASKSEYNSQIRRGADIISRIDYAKTEKRLQEMRSLVLDTVNGLIDAVLDETDNSAGSVYNLAIAGNTTMVHLLLGLPPQNIRESPYMPVVNSPCIMTAEEVGLHANPCAAVTFAPGVGSYVGGDITSGLLTTPVVWDDKNVVLFMDIGTNGEIAIGNAEFLMAAACSAGPAFEGSGISCGMRAAAGAIESFEADAAMEHLRFGVIGGGKPKGICGSGLISLLGELYTQGIIDRGGKIAEAAPSSRITKIGGTKALVLVKSSEAHDGREIVLTEADIDNLIRTKGAIYAACDLMLKNIGLTFDGISRVYIAGGFGRFIDVNKAVRIGLLPDIPRGKFTYLGNSSLTGATLALLSKTRREQLNALARRITYIDLSSDNRYMDAYVAALFLPHTDMGRFPSVG